MSGREALANEPARRQKKGKKCQDAFSFKKMQPRKPQEKSAKPVVSDPTLPQRFLTGHRGIPVSYKPTLPKRIQVAGSDTTGRYTGSST